MRLLAECLGLVASARGPAARRTMTACVFFCPADQIAGLGFHQLTLSKRICTIFYAIARFFIAESFSIPF
jgi:hypothetical protein